MFISMKEKFPILNNVVSQIECILFKEGVGQEKSHEDLLKEFDLVVYLCRVKKSHKSLACGMNP